MEEEKVKCRHFRARYVDFNGEKIDWPGGTYWCLCTMGAVGPDDEVVDRIMCDESRECFEVEKEEEFLI